MAVPKIIADFETQLSTAVSIGGTTFSIASALDDDNVALPSGLYYFTVDKGTSSKEYLKGTLSGNNLTSVSSVSRQGVETSGAVRAHRVGASVILTDFNTYKAYIDQTAVAGVANATTSLQGAVELGTSAEINSNTSTGSTGAGLAVTPDQLILSKYGLALTTLGTLTGTLLAYVSRIPPSGWALCDGSELARASYPTLFSIINPSGTFAVTIAAPGVFTKTGHGYIAGDMLSLTTTGALPTGLAVNTIYYVIATGLTTDNFEVSLLLGGTAVTTSGSQSGVHTVYLSNFGKGDGSSTFNVPDLRGRMAVGYGSGAKAITLQATAISSNQITVPSGLDLQQGMPVVFTGSGVTGLSSSSTYYVIAVSSTLISLASSQANANDGIVLTISGTPSSGVLTYNLSSRAIGQTGGEETHGLSTSEMSSHTHTSDAKGAASGSGAGASSGITGAATINPTGGDVPHNNMSPFLVLNYIIKT